MNSNNFKIVYMVHDLNDAGVHKRVAMLRDGGANMVIMGFYRGNKRPDNIHGFKTISLGQTHDGKFIGRIISTIKNVFTINKYKPEFMDANLIIARNLEMLAIAVAARNLKQKPITLVYESIDIHRLLLRNDFIGRALRGIEGWLSRRASMLITSSPAFIAEYFEKISLVKCPVMLLENKVLNNNITKPNIIKRAPHAPWRIGWFGAIRCRKSLNILTNIINKMDGKVEVIIRGKPALDQFDDFHNQTSNINGLSFKGAYKNPDDLENIYNEVHFTWAIDMFEEGLNSSWLLPNRIYEGGLYGAVPLAQANVETGRYINKIGTGVTFGADLESELIKFFTHLTADKYQELENKAAAIDISTWKYDLNDSKNVVKALMELSA